MPSKINQELVRAFNIILCENDIGITNLIVQSTDQAFSKKKDRIVISFDKNMDVGQCMKYLHNIRENIVETFCGSESGANMSFNTKFFPFNFNESQLTKDKKGYKFSVPIDKDIVLNLKCLLANGLARDVTGAMGRDFGLEYVEEYTSDESFDRKSYLYCMRFYDKRLQDYFVESFSSKVKDYKNSPKKTGDFLKIKDNFVHIKASIFDNVEFIREVVKRKASLICRDFQVPSSDDEVVESLKFPIIDLLYEIDIPVDFIFHTSYTGSGENSVLVPAVMEVIGNIIYYKILSKEQADDINKVFGMNVLNNVEDCTSPKHLPVSGNRGVYGIDFYDKDISYCVLNKIIESSVINKDHELAIDPELVRALSPAQSPFNSPTHAGLRTPPEQTGDRFKGDRDSGIGESPPRPEDSVAPSPSGGPGPSTELSYMEWESPTRSQDGALKDSPRRGSGKGETGGLFRVLREEIGQASTSSQPTNRWSSQSTSSRFSDSLWTQSGSSSWKGANKSGSAWTSQPIGFWSSPTPSAEPSLWSQSGPSSWKGAQAGANISEKEEKLIEALLYTLNLTNYTYGGVYTNFFAKDGEIVSCLHDNVDRKKYSQAVIDYIIEEYCEDEEKARELYDLDEFPFKLNYEEKKGKTVVANISSGALSNLKILFSQKFGKNVDTIDISVVKKVEKREKNEWVDRQRSEGNSLEEACQDCFPDEGAMKKIPIAFEGGEYVLDRSRDTCEVNLLFKEQLRRFRRTSLEKRKSSDKPLTEKEKELFKALLYWFNLNNYTFEYTHTNFIVENGKIASFIDNGVNVKEYLQELRDSTIKDYYVTEEEAYDLNEFPFKFLSNCEKNQETTVVANISPGALSNLKKLFIREHEKEVKIGDIDIDIVEKGVESKRSLWVNSEVKSGKSLKVVIPTCYPKESKLKGIPIVKGGSGYSLLHSYPTKEKKPRDTTTTFKAVKESKKDDSSSGYSSGFVTDAEKVSSKAEATTSSGYESMDCENTGKRLPKRKSQSPVGEDSPRKSPKRDSSPLSMLKSLSLSSPSHQTDKSS